MAEIDVAKKEIRRIVKEAFLLEDQRDIEKVLKFFTDDVIAQKANIPQFQGIEALRRDYEIMFKSREGISASTDGRSEYIEVSSSRDMAWDCGCYTTEFKGPQGTKISKGKYMCTWRKVADQWKIAAFCVTSDLPERKIS